MGSHFLMDEPKLVAPLRPDLQRMFFDTFLTNVPNRLATVRTIHVELWLVTGPTSGDGFLVSHLVPDLRQSSWNWEWNFKAAGERKPLRLAWDYTAQQLQLIENHREAKPFLQLRGMIGVVSQWPHIKRPLMPEDFGWENAISPTGSGIIPVPISQDEWVELLAAIGFKHTALLESPSDLPHDFDIPAAHLQRAWNEHRNNAPEHAMLHCANALECLGFSLFNDETLQHRAVLEKLMPGAEPKLIDAFDAYLKHFRTLLHFGRHARGTPVKLGRPHSELAVITTNAILLFLANARGVQSKP